MQMHLHLKQEGGSCHVPIPFCWIWTYAYQPTSYHTYILPLSPYNTHSYTHTDTHTQNIYT